MSPFFQPTETLKGRSTKMSAFSATRDESLALQQAQTLYGSICLRGDFRGTISAVGVAYIPVQVELYFSGGGRSPPPCSKNKEFVLSLF